jgi:N-acetylglutamate synthase-like GNAT family acetyltransferase
MRREGHIRLAKEGDENDIHQLIKDLAEFEKAPNEVLLHIEIRKVLVLLNKHARRVQ